MSNERAKSCECGARLRWEYRSYPSTWVAMCESGDCGHVTTPDDQASGLPEFLGIAIKPSTPPWIREFLKASAIEGLSWEHWPAACPECERDQLVFTIDLAPIHEPRQASICLNCGMVGARFMTQGRLTDLIGGYDWATPDQAVTALRRGIKERSEHDHTEPSGGDGWCFEL